MADQNADSLTETQEEALATFLAVTNQEPSEAIPLLRRSQWNVQIAIAKFFDGEAPDPLVEAQTAAAAAAAAAPAPAPAGRHGVLLDDIPFSAASSSTNSVDAAPRIVPQPENRTFYKPPLILGLLLSPVQILTRLFLGSFGLLGYLFPFLRHLFRPFSSAGSRGISRVLTTGRRMLNPRDTAARFIREFGEEYGDHELPFFDDGYAQAFDRSKRDLQYLMVLLISPEHDETGRFVRETLLAPDVQAFLRDPAQRILLWAGNVQDSEAYQVSVALKCTQFPFCALIVPPTMTGSASSSMTIMTRIMGPTTPSVFLGKSRAAIAQYAPVIDRQRAARAEQQATRNLREEQTSAYERSLARDRERTQQRRAAEEAQAQAEADARRQAADAEQQDRLRMQWLRWRAQKLPPEPAAEVRDVTRLSIRLPSGERLVRRFAGDTPMDDLYAFVDCQSCSGETEGPAEAAKVGTIEAPEGYEHRYGFRFVSPMPRVVYAHEDGGTLASRIGRSGNLMIESIDEDA